MERSRRRQFFQFPQGSKPQQVPELGSASKGSIGSILCLGFRASHRAQPIVNAQRAPLHSQEYVGAGK